MLQRPSWSIFSTPSRLRFVANGLLYGETVTARVLAARSTGRSSCLLTAYGRTRCSSDSMVAIIFMMEIHRLALSVHTKNESLHGEAAFTYVVAVDGAWNLHYLLMASIWPVMLYTRARKLWRLSRFNIPVPNRFSTSLDLVGGMLRILAAIKKWGGIWLSSGFLLSAIMNGIILLQY
jgi:hypothetical protein